MELITPHPGDFPMNPIQKWVTPQAKHTRWTQPADAEGSFLFQIRWENANLSSKPEVFFDVPGNTPAFQLPFRGNWEQRAEQQKLRSKL